MSEKNRCEICNRNFKDEEGFDMHNSAKHPKPAKKEKSIKLNPKKIKNWGIFIVVSLVIIFGLYFMLSGAKTLPPTDMQGHVESSPLSHVSKDQMSIPVQKHMLEHVDGQQGVRGGVIINYNCDDYNCEEGLIENLESFGYEFDYVYVTPFKNMGAKIALTRLNRIETLDSYDEGIIRNFIF